MLKVPRSTLKNVHNRRAAAGTTGQTNNAAAGATDTTTDSTAANGNAASGAGAGAGTGIGTGTGTGAGTGAGTGTGNTAAGDTTTNDTTGAGTPADTNDTTTAAGATTTSAAAAANVNASASSASTKAATTKATTSSSAPSSAAPSVVVVTSTAADSIASSAPASSVVAPTTMTGVAKAATTAAADPYATATGIQTTRTYATDNWLSSDAATATGVVGGSTSGPSAGGIVGIVAACLLALVSLGAAVGYFIRRQKRIKRRARFNRSKFVRQSVALPDNDFNEKPQMGTQNALALARANNGGLIGAAADGGPRPPSMVERRIHATPAPGQVVAPANGGQYDQYHNDNSHQQYNYHHGAQQGQYDYNHGHQQGQYDQYAASGHQQGQYDQYGAGNQQYDQYATGDQQQSNLTRQPSMAPSVASNYPDAQEEYYQDDSHASVTPYQQEQYAEINRQLATSGDHLAVPNAGNGNASVSRSLSTTYTSLNSQKPSKTHNEYSEDDRSGTPTDRNPQQTYFQPSGNDAGKGVAGHHRAAPTRAAHRSIDDDENGN
ncbi:hypothetical protein FRB94_010155 [Tulasnella sp. JGI-2019a]|nr:hypothetical protein FRB94_010155 [Tulasnella sp. JGI-2019a]